MCAEEPGLTALGGLRDDAANIFPAEREVRAPSSGQLFLFAGASAQRMSPPSGNMPKGLPYCQSTAVCPELESLPVHTRLQPAPFLRALSDYLIDHRMASILMVSALILH